MMHGVTLANLEANLVPFMAKKIDSTLIWHLDEVDSDHLKNNCSYMVDDVNDKPSKVFFAERYGGIGIQRNGGGARCGFDGYFQVKGIGANPLVGEGTDLIHSNGALSASAAIYEAIWAEALSSTLPFGAVRTLGILLTDKFIDNPMSSGTGRIRRALMVREAVIRPAHFERAPYFKPQPQYAGKLGHDADRVKELMPLLPTCLPAPLNGFSHDARLDPQIYCIDGLCELARRQAWQMGFCQAHFLRLTSSPSNIAVDGRLLDFNGVSSLFPGDHQLDFNYKIRLTEMVKEPSMLKLGLSELCFYLGKYLFGADFTAISRQKVDETFVKTFEEVFYRYRLEMLGYPFDIFPSGKITKDLKELVDGFSTLAKQHIHTLHTSNGQDKEGYSLEDLVMGLHYQSQHLPAAAKPKMSDRCLLRVLSLLNEVTGRYTCASASKGIDSLQTIERMEQLARKRTKSRLSIEKSNMYKKINTLLEDYGSQPQELRQALLVMSEEIRSFVVESLGDQQPITLVV